MDHEIGINRLPFRDLGGNALKTVFAALRIDGGDKRGATTDDGAQQC
jgi:hypothetical protein